MVTISRGSYEALQGRIAKLDQQVSVLTEVLRLSHHKQFGASSEKSKDTLMKQLCFLFNEPEVFSASEEENVVVVSEHKRHKKHEYTLDIIPEDITVVGCWAHARRKFDEAIKSQPKGKGKGGSASQGLAYCDLLFNQEEGWTDLEAEQRYEERLKQAKPVLDAMLSWANSRTAAPQSALGKAFHYLKEQWPYLTNYLKDGRL